MPTSPLAFLPLPTLPVQPDNHVCTIQQQTDQNSCRIKKVSTFRWHTVEEWRWKKRYKSGLVEKKEIGKTFFKTKFESKEKSYEWG